jgi:uroporphyrinogen decarboxylase
MGLGLYFADGEGPRFDRPLRDQDTIRRLPIPDPEEQLGYVLNAVRQIQRALAGQVPLIGFAGSPFTLACYMVEGGSSADFHVFKTMLYARPDLVHHILDTNCRAVTGYLNAQINAGVDAVMIFDTWGGILSTPAFREFSLAYLERIIEGLSGGENGEPVPSIVFTKGGGQWLKDIAATGCDAVGVDWTTDIGAARALIGRDVALQGNLDPAVLFSSPDVIRKETQQVLSAFGPGGGHVFNLGHGISQFAPPEHVGVLVDAVHELSRPFH